MVELGQKYRDTMTGFEGVATARSTFLYGCVRVMLEAVDKEGTPEEFWFDEQRLQSAAGVPVKTTAKSGGPRNAPPRTGLR